MTGPGKAIHFMLASHMDLFWMAPPRDCLDRGCDIINRALDLCLRHGEYCFYIETTVFVDYYLSRFPQNRTLLQKLIAENRLEIGACYVDRYEHMHGGESIVRHYIYGKRYLAEEIGADSRGVCHSDLPGLSPQLPQICALSRIDYYIRARGPVGLFNWQAPDGSSILYASVGYTYGRITRQRLRREIDASPSIRQGLAVNDYLMRGGYGDLEMPDGQILEDVKRFNLEFPELRCANSSPSIVLSPHVQNLDLLPRLSGEWPVGWASVAAANVQTFQAIFRLENDLLALERLAALGIVYGEHLTDERHEADWWTILGRFKGDMAPVRIEPGRELYEVWKALLFVQDHNYAGFGGPKSELDRNIVLQHAAELARNLADGALRRLLDKIDIPHTVHGRKVLFALPIFNPLAWSRNAAVTVDNETFLSLGAFRVVDADGNEADSALNGRTLMLHAKSMPPLGYKVYFGVAANGAQKHPGVEVRQAEERILLENECLRVAVDLNSGTLESLFDKRQDRELAQNSVGARFMELIAYGESGVDVVYGFTGERTRESNIRVSVHHSDTVSAGILIESELYGNRVTKLLTLGKDSASLGIHIEMFCWGMKDRQVRLCLPFTGAGYRRTRYGVPYYAMTWPDMMRGIDDDVVLGVGAFNPDEIDACSRKHIRDVEKWVDIGYEGFGAVLTTSTSAIHIDGSRIEPLLLRTGISCGDPHVWVLNQGHQIWDFAINFHASEEMPEHYGWESAMPPLAMVCEPHAGILSCSEKSYYSLSGTEVIVTSVKPAYANSEDVVLRFYEPSGAAGSVRIACPLPVLECCQVDLLEQETGTADHSGNVVETSIRPYEIKNLYIRYRKGNN